MHQPLRLFLFILSFLTYSSFALADTQNWNFLNEEENPQTSIQYVETDHGIELTMELGAWSFEEVSINQTTYLLPHLPDGYPLLAAKSPDLERVFASLRIDPTAQYTVEVIGSDYLELNQVKLAPSKGNLTRDILPSQIAYEFGPAYQKNEFFPGELADLSDPFVIREERGLNTYFYPLQYNPVSETLRIYREISIRLVEVDETPVNPLLSRRDGSKSTSEFEAIYEQQFINYPSAKYTVVPEDGEMLIICHPNFWEVMQPFVSWKIQRGMPTTMVDVTQIGNLAAINSYIADFYTNHNLTYLLLVGDANFVPTNTLASGHSDNAFGYLVGNDSYPDVFVGRFSAETVADAQTMVDRVIDYELNPVVGSHYEHALGIASQEGPGDDQEYDYQHMRVMQNKLLAYHYSTASEFFEGSQGGLDAAGDPTSTMVANQVNTASGVILYTGHGSTTSFSTSGLSNTHVDNLSNTGKLPFVWAVACVNGNFVGNTCFGEAWTRSQHNNEPAGAIATLMSTINQSWNPPMAGQDEMVDILVESFSNNIKRSFGGVSMHGCMHMNDAYGNQGFPMTDTWTCFGDPSVMLRTATPQSMIASHDPVAFIGATSFAVQVNVEGALVALTAGGEILGTAIVQNGVALVSFPALSSIQSYTITVTAYNYVPYVGSFDVVPNEGPYVSLNTYSVDLGSGMPSTIAEYNSSIQLNVQLENVGVEMASGVVGVLSSSDLHVDILNDTYVFGNIDSAQTVLVNAIFTVQISDSVPNMHQAAFQLELTDDSLNTWTSFLTIPIYAPELSLSNLGLEELNPVVDNGRIDPGETIHFTIETQNLGEAGTADIDLSITCSSPYVDLIDSSFQITSLNAAGTVQHHFSFSVHSSAPAGIAAEFQVFAQAGHYSAELSIIEEIGLIVEDWELNHFQSYAWNNSISYPWVIVSNNSFEGTHSARSAIIPASASSVLEISIDVLAADSISFYKKVSCEPEGWDYYDFLEFFIDNNSMGKWAGEIDWSREAFPISAGTHTLKWVYEKDAYYVGGQDAAWIDFIQFPAMEVNYAPYLLSSLDTFELAAGEYFMLPLEAFDPNPNDALSYNLVDAPAFLQWSNAVNWSIQLEGTPMLSDTGFHQVVFQVDDGTLSSPEYSFVIRVYDPVHVAEWEKELSFFAYPNPSKDQLHVQLPPDSGTGSLSLYSISGQLIRSIELHSTRQITLSLSDLPAGSYRLQWKSQETVLSFPVVKMK